MADASRSSRRVVLAGGTGMIGSLLVPELVKRGFEAVILSRSAADRDDGAREVVWDGRTVEAWSRELEGAFAIINVAGKSIDDRHTEANKKLIRSSRIDSTRALGEAAAGASSPPGCWIQTSAVGFYGDTGGRICREDDPPGNDFLAEVVSEWESTFHDAKPPAARTIVFRAGPVLSRRGGALEKLASLTRWGLGGAAGSGRQFMSWIHERDLVLAYLWALEGDLAGTFNLCAPEPVRNRDLMKQLRSVLGRPWSPPVPEFAVRIGGAVIGTAPEMALVSTRCSADLLMQTGFAFAYPTLPEALADLLS